MTWAYLIEVCKYSQLICVILAILAFACGAIGAKVIIEDGYEPLAFKLFWTGAIVLIISVITAIAIPSAEVLALKAVAEGDTTPQIIELAKRWSIK